MEALGTVLSNSLYWLQKSSSDLRRKQLKPDQRSAQTSWWRGACHYNKIEYQAKNQVVQAFVEYGKENDRREGMSILSTTLKF